MSLNDMNVDVLKLILHSLITIKIEKNPVLNEETDAFVTGNVSGFWMRLTNKLFSKLISDADMRAFVIPRFIELRDFQVAAMIEMTMRGIEYAAETWFEHKRYRQLKSTFRVGVFFHSIDTQMCSCKIDQKPRLYIDTSAGCDRPNSIFGFSSCVQVYLPEEYCLFPSERGAQQTEDLKAWITDNRQTVKDRLVAKLREMQNKMMQRGAISCLFDEQTRVLTYSV
jgi:hypothetical protein